MKFTVKIPRCRENNLIEEEISLNIDLDRKITPYEMHCIANTLKKSYLTDEVNDSIKENLKVGGMLYYVDLEECIIYPACIVELFDTYFLARNIVDERVREVFYYQIESLITNDLAI